MSRAKEQQKRREELGRELGLMTPEAFKEKVDRDREILLLHDAQDRVRRAQLSITKIGLERQALDVRLERAKIRLTKAEKDVRELS